MTFAEFFMANLPMVVFSILYVVYLPFIAWQLPNEIEGL